MGLVTRTDGSRFDVDSPSMGLNAGLSTTLTAFSTVSARRSSRPGHRTRRAYEDTVMTADTVRQRIEGMTVLVARSDAGRIIGTIGGVVHGTEGRVPE
jgi:hypothetical protein